MERIRAALLGCILTGGVIFGARPALPDDEPVRPVVASSGAGSRIGLTPEQLARWVRPVQAGACLSELRLAAVAIDSAGRMARVSATVTRGRCNAGRVRRRRRR